MLQREEKKEIYRAIVTVYNKNYRNITEIWRKITKLLHESGQILQNRLNL